MSRVEFTLSFFHDQYKSTTNKVIKQILFLFVYIVYLLYLYLNIKTKEDDKKN
jgi:hypothetical protein